MINSIIYNPSENSEERLFTREFHFKSGINLLFGGNGAGKTSLCEALRSLTHWKISTQFKRDITIQASGQFKVYYYSNSEHNVARNKDKGLDSFFDFTRAYDSFHQSEGQSVLQALCDFLNVLQDDECVPVDSEDVFIMDELDSGLDVEACIYAVKTIKSIIKRKPKIQVFITFNQYEISKLADEWLNVYTGQWESTTNSYEEFVDYMCYVKPQYYRQTQHAIRLEENDKGVEENEN